jgi:hypothetical protein
VDAVRRDLKDMETALRTMLTAAENALKADLLALHHDLQTTEAALRLDIEKVRREMAEAKIDIVKWLVGIGLHFSHWSRLPYRCGLPDFHHSG